MVDQEFHKRKGTEDTRESCLFKLAKSKHWFPSGLSLGMLPFMIFVIVNDLPEVCKSYLSIFADDAVLMREALVSRVATVHRET